MSAVYVVIWIGLTIFIVYFIEKRRCLYFVTRDPSQFVKSSQLSAYLYCLVVLIERPAIDSQVNDYMRLALRCFRDA